MGWKQKDMKRLTTQKKHGTMFLVFWVLPTCCRAQNANTPSSLTMRLEGSLGVLFFYMRVSGWKLLGVQRWTCSSRMAHPSRTFVSTRSTMYFRSSGINIVVLVGKVHNESLPVFICIKTFKDSIVFFVFTYICVFFFAKLHVKRYHVFDM